MFWPFRTSRRHIGITRRKQNEVNPCKGVRQFREDARERYITDEEYAALYSVAPPVVQIAMELAYLYLARQGDVLALQKSQILPEGIFIRQGKTAAKQIKAWSDRLAAATEMAKHSHSRPACPASTCSNSRTGVDIRVMDLTAAGNRPGTKPRRNTLTCCLISLFMI